MMQQKSQEHNHKTKGLLRLTMACNEACPFCNVPKENYSPLTASEASVMAEVDEFARSGEQTLTISGGEPTLLKKRLIRVISYARSKDISFVELQSNAVLIDEDYAEKLAAAGLTSAFISLLSHQEEWHDFLAGMEGAYPRCLRGIDALLAVGISVTLNPVIASCTEDKVFEYIEFVAQRFPKIKSISLSAVQPHGRASNRPELLPNYRILSEQIPLAMKAARQNSIRLLNPYCGLPVCIGWTGGLESCVEVIESQHEHQARGLNNQGNKSHGPPCQLCVFRPQCGGAWHSYWEHRGGEGIKAPAQISWPWEGAGEYQDIVQAQGGLEEKHWQQLREARKATVWLLTDHLNHQDLLRLLLSGCTELAWFYDPSGLYAHSPSAKKKVKSLRLLLRLLSSQRKLRLHLLIPADATRQDQQAVVALSYSLGIGSVKKTKRSQCFHE